MADPVGTKAEVIALHAKPCPNCQKPAHPRHRPFCSKRCADIDLGHWFNEDFRVQTEDEPESESDLPEN